MIKLCFLAIAAIFCLLPPVVSLEAAAVADSSTNEQLAIGFHLGHSYGTAVAHFPNGTICKLVKVDGTATYEAFMHREIEKRYRASWNPFRLRGSEREYYEAIKKLVFNIPSRVDILGEMLTTLRQASEVALGATLPDSVYISAPRIVAWDDDIEARHPLNKARKRAGIKPFVSGHIHQIYLEESNAVLAASGRYLCSHLRCWGPEISDEKGIDAMIYFINISKTSVYTSISRGSCFFLPPYDYNMGTIQSLSNFQYQGKCTVGSRQFQAYLISQLTQLPSSTTSKYMVMLTGEAAAYTEYFDAVAGLVQHLQNDLHSNLGHVAFKSNDVELLLSDEPIYAAAMGAAFWMRSEMDNSFCGESSSREPISLYSDEETDPRERLAISDIASIHDEL